MKTPITSLIIALIGVISCSAQNLVINLKVTGGKEVETELTLLAADDSPGVRIEHFWENGELGYWQLNLQGNFKEKEKENLKFEYNMSLRIPTNPQPNSVTREMGWSTTTNIKYGEEILLMKSDQRAFTIMITEDKK